MNRKCPDRVKKAVSRFQTNFMKAKFSWCLEVDAVKDHFGNFILRVRSDRDLKPPSNLVKFDGYDVIIIPKSTYTTKEQGKQVRKIVF